MTKIRERYPGEKITFTTRAIAREVVDNKGMYEKILEVFESTNEGLSAKDIARALFKKGLIPSDERQKVAPRLTEMSYKGWIEPFGEKRREDNSRVRVSVYRLRKTPKEIREEIKTRVREEVKK